MPVTRDNMPLGADKHCTQIGERDIGETALNSEGKRFLYLISSFK